MKEIEPKRSAASWLAELAKGRYGEYALSVLTALLGVACSLIPYFIIIRLITALVNGTAELTYCLTLCAWMAGFWVLRYVLHSISTSLSHHATFNVLANTRTRLLDKLATLPLGAVLDRSSGSSKNIIVERVDSIETTLAHLLPEMTTNIVGALAVFVLLFLNDWRMGLSMLIVVPLGTLCFASMFSGYNEKFQRTVTATKALNDTAVEYISGIEVIKAFGQSKTSYAKFVSAAKEGADCFIDWMRGSLFGQVAGMAIFPSTLLGILPVGCVLYMHGTLSAETFLTVIVLSFGVMQPLITAFSYTDDIAQVKTIVDEIAEVLSGEDMQRPESAEKLPADNSIELKNVRFAYHDKEVLHGVNLHIVPGTVNALVGPSGSGKSTIARLIASLWDVKDGTIKLGGVDIRTLPLAECTKRIAYVSQDNYLFDLSVIDNIRMGRKGATDAEVIDAAKKCGCHELIMGLENGYQTVCGASGGHLSGGERQRISIARAVLKDAPIVILDEATSYTDPENEAVIQSALARLVRGKTLLVIAHRLSTIAVPIRSLLSIKVRSKPPAHRRSFLPPARFIKPCGKPTSASKTTGRWRNAQDTEKILRLLRGGQPQAVYGIHLAGRGQRHLLCHAYSGSRHRHSGAAGKERHYGNFMDEPWNHRRFSDCDHRHQHEGHHAPDPCRLPRLRQQAD